jgi:hypothetical protein
MPWVMVANGAAWSTSRLATAQAQLTCDAQGRQQRFDRLTPLHQRADHPASIAWRQQHQLGGIAAPDAFTQRLCADNAGLAPANRRCPPMPSSYRVANALR